MTRAWLVLLAAAAGCQVVGGGGARWSGGGGGPSSAPAASSSGGASSGGTPYVRPASASAAPDRYDDTEDPATSQHHQIRKRFVSTKASAAKLNGLPGQTCTKDSERVARERGLVGPCWDPPGGVTFAPLAHLTPGMRKLQAADFTSNSPGEVYWLEMPREATLEAERWNTRPVIPAVDRPTEEYLPYSIQGFPAPALPPLVGKSLRVALAALDALDLPLWVVVDWSECEGAHDTVCQMSEKVSEKGLVQLTLAMRVRYRGTPKEEREVPAGLEGMTTEDAVAKLKAIGFTNVAVVEADLPCARGVVCSTMAPRWYGTNERIDLQVRKAKAER